jgi:ABC-type proline/glycine betaine transport system ATPase subunit
MTQTEKKELQRKIEEGVKASIARALEEHKRMGRSIVVWRDGKVVTIPPEEINPYQKEG